MHKIVSKTWIDCLRVLLGLPLLFINADELLSLAGVLAKAIVGDSIKPGRKTRFAAEAAEVFVSPQKRFLGEIVRERNIGADQLAEQASHTRLVIPDQLRKGVVVVIDKNAGNEICIGKRHAPILGQRRSFVFRPFEFPNQ